MDIRRKLFCLWSTTTHLLHRTFLRRDEHPNSDSANCYQDDNSDSDQYIHQNAHADYHSDTNQHRHQHSNSFDHSDPYSIMDSPLAK